MEAYLAPSYYEPRSSFSMFALALALGSVMFILFVVQMAGAHGMISKSSPEISMSKIGYQELVSKAVRDEVKILEGRMAARESLMNEVIDMVHQHQVRIAELEEDITKAMGEMGALRASINSLTSTSTTITTADDNLPATSTAPSPPSELSSRTPSDDHDSSDDDSINGVEDYESEPRVSSSPDQAHKVYSPQLDSALADELAELAGWGLDEDASEDVSDGNIADQDAEGETDDEYEAAP